MSWTGCQNNPIYLNFYLQKSLESFEKKSADKMWFDKNSRRKVPCPVLDRVKGRTFLYPLQHCVAHAILNFYTYILYSTLKHVRNLLSIFFFQRRQEHSFFFFFDTVMSLTWTLYIFFCHPSALKFLINISPLSTLKFWQKK